MQHIKRSVFSVILNCAILLFAQIPISLANTVDGPAPDFTLEGADGQRMQLSDLRGEIVMINFWASWCGPCRQEMPLLDQLHNQYKALGFTVLGVNVEENPVKAKDLLKQIPVSFPILFDSDNKVSKRYNVIAMPSTILVDRNGNMRYLHQGYQPGYEMQYQDQVRALIRE